MAEGSSEAGLIFPGWRTCTIGKSFTLAPAPCDGSMKATAQFDVPRSIPTRNSRGIVVTSDVQFEFPAARAVLFQATQFERPDFRDCGLKIHRHESSGFTFERCFNRRNFFEVVAARGIFDRVANAIFTSDR